MDNVSSANNTTPIPGSKIGLWVFYVIKLLSKVLWKLKIEGKENLPQNAPFILCPNHESLLDGVWVATILSKKQIASTIAIADQVYYPKKKLLSAITLYSLFWNFNDSLEESIQAIQSNKNLLIFPEGKRTHNGCLEEFKTGAAYISLRTNAPIVPICLHGGYTIYPRHQRFPKLFNWRKLKRYQVKVIIGKPIYPPLQEDIDIEMIKSLTEKILNAISVMKIGYQP